jgi:hypothetical protein
VSRTKPSSFVADEGQEPGPTSERGGGGHKESRFSNRWEVSQPRDFGVTACDV